MITQRTLHRMVSELCADIEDSTALWEDLDPDVMDRAINLHHACVRSCLLACNVYECATEGDSFVLAAHSAEDAVRVCALIHRKLMTCDWCVACINIHVRLVCPAQLCT